ncbi:response regulator transcription factor [Emticicia sp. W12TSBA100-4]|uniref:response regulator transcription factor n=1 Tax=Emticicia sp. W12TSBA100-4 TaxID=3160965 RepID=UPI003305E590
MKIKISIADDHVILLETLKSILEREEEFEILATYNNSFETIKGIEKNQPNVLLLDLSMPEQGIDNTHLATGLEVLEFIKKSNLNINVIVLSNFDDFAIVQKAVRLGAKSYLLKNVTTEVLKQAIRTVFLGNIFFQKNIQKKINTPAILNYLTNEAPLILSKRERVILDLVSRGFTTGEIASNLELHKDTVSDYRNLLMKKFDAKNAPDLIRLAYQWKILQ